MKKPKVTMTIERSTEAYGAYAQVKGGVIATMGESYAELKGNILEAVNLFLKTKALPIPWMRLILFLTFKAFLISIRLSMPRLWQAA